MEGRKKMDGMKEEDGWKEDRQNKERRWMEGRKNMGGKKMEGVSIFNDNDCCLFYVMIVISSSTLTAHTVGITNR